MRALLPTGELSLVAKMNTRPNGIAVSPDNKSLYVIDSDARALLSWDLETYLPKKGVAFRAEQLAHLSGHTHRLFIAKKVGDWIQDDRRSGGCLVDKNCHHFDMMNWWVDSRPRCVAAFGGCAVNRVIEGEHQANDHATVSFEYENGVRGTLQHSIRLRTAARRST